MGTGANTVGSVQANYKNNLTGYANSTQGFYSDAREWRENEGTNKAHAEANLQNTIRTGYKVGLLNVQRAQQQKKLLEKGISLSRARAETLGAATANAAANGTIGSSVDAVIQDIDSKIGEAQASLDADYVQTAENFDIELRDLIMSGEDALLSPQQLSQQERQRFSKGGTASAVGTGLLQSAAKYGADVMKLGLGPAPGSGSTGGAGQTVSGVNGSAGTPNMSNIG